MGVPRARCIVVATEDDLANLETALNARALNPSLRVVLRLFDPDLARRVERAFGISISRSVSALAAPAFAAAAMGPYATATIPAGNRLLVLAERRIDVGSRAEGETLAELERRTRSRILVVKENGRLAWRPPGDSRLVAGQELVVVTTRRGLSEVVARTQAKAV
jgi:Trk K+ transport system NAD-binding subunit